MIDFGSPHIEMLMECRWSHVFPLFVQFGGGGWCRCCHAFFLIALNCLTQNQSEHLFENLMSITRKGVCVCVCVCAFLLQLGRCF